MCVGADCNPFVRRRLQMVTALVNPLDCVKLDHQNRSLSNGSDWTPGYVVESSVAEGTTLSESELDRCFTVEHMSIAAICSVSLVVYILFVLRLIRVQGNLSAVEFNRRRPFSVREVCTFMLVYIFGCAATENNLDSCRYMPA